jgi:putative ATP-dependent endonuclease of OLD family
MPKKKTKCDTETLPSLSNIPRPRLHKLCISNFRCIGSQPVEVELDDIVVLVGPNNVGKSSILKAYEVVMSHGSKQGELSIDDFPNGKIETKQLPTIELETVVFEKTLPGERWVRTDPSTGDMYVKEKWTWDQPGSPKKVGWDVGSGCWHETEGPWGAPNVAQARRPEPHRVGAFDNPEEQAKETAKLLKEALVARVKNLAKQKKPDEQTTVGQTAYNGLIDTVRKLQKEIAEDAKKTLATIEEELSKTINSVFPGYSITFDARAEDDIEKCINLFKSDPIIRMGPTGNHQATIGLRILSEQKQTKSDSESDRPHVLLMDEPEICLHPDAIREACRVLYDLPKSGNWQVMITTHSPVFIDFTRDNTSIVRVERTDSGNIQGTTVFRPKRIKLDDDDKIRPKMLNMCDQFKSLSL